MTSIIASSKGGLQFDPVPAGNHVARCYSMVYSGTIETEYLGEKKKAKKVHITWELPNELKVFKQENGEQPMVLSKAFTLSLSEKSTLRPFLESWRGKAFTQAEADGFDITNVVGHPCMLNVIHKTKKDGNIKAEISALSSMPKGLTCPPQINQSVIFSVEEFDADIFSKFPDWLKDEIRSSDEYKAMQSPTTTVIDQEVAEIFPSKAESVLDDDTSGLPF